jgi:GT2 family glycosyltransferase
MSNGTDAPPTVEVLIPAYGARDLLRDCLQSVDANRPDGSVARVEAAVLDDSSPDGGGDMVATEFRWVRLVRSATYLGNTGANNLLAETSTADYLLLLNSDTRWLEDVVGPRLRALERKPRAAGVGAGLVWPDGAPQLQDDIAARWYALDRSFEAARLMNALTNQLLPRVDTTYRLHTYGGSRHGTPTSTVPFVTTAVPILAFAA